MSQSPDLTDPQAQRWATYADGIMKTGLVRTVYDSWTYSIPTLSQMLKHAPPPARVLSIGCGLALFDVLMIGWGYDVTSIDSSADVLRRAGRVGDQLGVKLNLIEADAFHLDRFHDSFDVAFSAGLVEHWHGTRTVDLLMEHARCAPRIQVEVPTSYTLSLPGRLPEVLEDTHLYRPREFRRRFQAAGLQVEQTYPVQPLPVLPERVLRNLIPPPLYRIYQVWLGRSMGIGCVARRVNRPDT